MEGLRILGCSSEFPLTYPGRGVPSPAARITTPPTGISTWKASTWENLTSLGQTDLPQFFHDDAGNNNPPSLRLASVFVSGPGRVYADQRVFEGVLREIEADVWVVHFLKTLPYGFHYSDNATQPGGTVTYFLGTSFVWSLWTCRHVAETGRFVTKCLVLNPAGARFSIERKAVNITSDPVTHDHPDGQRATMTHLTPLFEALNTFQGDAHSALWMPLVFAANALRWREKSILGVLDTIRMVESKTGHGSWGSGRFEESRDAIPELTAELGSAFNTVGNTMKHLGIIGQVLDYLEEVEGRMARVGMEKSEGVKVSDASILEAVKMYRRQCLSAKEQCGYLEIRIRNQTSVLFAFLTHEDSKINIEVANASKALAEATAKDSSSMKTIAILTMSFLPATFFAALFSVPSLGWTEPEKFPLYWAFTIPITIGTFVVWVSLTQREAVVETMSRWSESTRMLKAASCKKP